MIERSRLKKSIFAFLIPCLSLLGFCVFGPGLPAQSYAQDKFLDSVEMKSGNSLKVSLKEDEAKGAGGTFAVVETSSGGTFRLQKGRAFRRTKPADDVDREYQQILANLKDDPEAHWTTYHWLERQKNGKSRFRKEREYHLERIVALDRSDRKALSRLGHIEIDGHWIKRDLLNSYHGYEKIGTKWYSKRQAELHNRNEQAKQKFGEKRTALSRWKKHVLPKESANSATKKLFQLVDNESIPEVMKMFKRERNPQIRRLYVDAIGSIPTPLANSTLISIAITDKREEVRDRARVLCRQEHYSPYSSVTKAARYLNNPNNDYIRRAGELIGDLAADNASYFLVNALVTNHKVKTGKQAGRTQFDVVNGGVNSFGVAGNDGVEKILPVRNSEVLNSLRAITGEDFGFDEARWRQWYIENYTVQENDLMRDD